VGEDLAQHGDDGRVVMWQEWYDLLFLHWEVPFEALRSRVPRPLEIDTFEGRAFVGLVPFGMRGVRPSWGPAIPGVSAFLETNVRTYVKLEGGEPGVWFFSLDAASTPAVLGARWCWHLPYFRARMSLRRGEGGTIAYRSERLWPGPRPAGCQIRYRPTGRVETAAGGTLDHFLIERYVLYARRGDRLFRGRVRHEPYRSRRAEVIDLEESLLGAAGFERPDEAPLTHHAEGVRVRIGPLSRIEARVEASVGGRGRAV
jgi:uncharacterized protein YqjF (DUF2071 family)